MIFNIDWNTQHKYKIPSNIELYAIFVKNFWFQLILVWIKKNNNKYILPSYNQNILIDEVGMYIHFKQKQKHTNLKLYTYILLPIIFLFYWLIKKLYLKSKI